jgi:hypothetical protein
MQNTWFNSKNYEFIQSSSELLFYSEFTQRS